MEERVDDRRVISGVVQVLKSGGRWSDAPREVYGPKKTLYNRFVSWVEKPVYSDLFETLSSARYDKHNQQSMGADQIKIDEIRRQP